jgi:hypothetical protein
MDVHDCDSATAIGFSGYARKSEYHCGHYDHRHGDFQSGDEFVDDHCFDLHADRAGKHLSAGHRGLQRGNFGCDVHSGDESRIQHYVHSDA